MSEQDIEYRLKRLEIAAEGHHDRLSRVEQKTFGSSGVMKPDTTTRVSGYVETKKEPARPVPKKQTQSTYGWSYRKNAFVALNFAEHCAFYFTGVKNRLRQFLKRNAGAAKLYAYACAIIKNIQTEIYEKDVAIDTRKIMKAHDEIIDLLRKHPTLGEEIVKSLEYMDKVRNLFE